VAIDVARDDQATVKGLVAHLERLKSAERKIGRRITALSGHLADVSFFSTSPPGCGISLMGTLVRTTDVTSAQCGTRGDRGSDPSRRAPQPVSSWLFHGVYG
jgi:hypothetical protein